MITKSQLSEILSDQLESFRLSRTISREVKIPADSGRIIIITGVRRCGKSTLLKKDLIKKGKSLYINFEDPRLINFSLEDFTQLQELAKESGKTFILLDEIQNIPRWELFAGQAHDRGIQLYITGSNATMLSRELGTHLTGRYQPVELFPFSFNEFLKYSGKKRNFSSFAAYFESGGFPEYLEERDDNYHRILLRDIIMRDIAVRRNILNENQLIRLAVHLLSNIGKPFSYNNVTKLLEFKSVRTVIDYCDYLNESYLLDFIPFYSPSIKRQIANPRKPYAIDPVFAKSNSLSFSKDPGRRLENFVYLKLRRQYHEIYYFADSRSECDFLIREKGQIIMAVQSCWELNNTNQEREINGIKMAMKEAGTDKGVIITYNQEDRLDGIELIPAWKWM